MSLPDKIKVMDITEQRGTLLVLNVSSFYGHKPDYISADLVDNLVSALDASHFPRDHPIMLAKNKLKQALEQE